MTNYIFYLDLVSVQEVKLEKGSTKPADNFMHYSTETEIDCGRLETNL